MRRIVIGLMACLGFTGMVLVLPVYAAPAPAPHPVKSAVDEVPMGSVTQPADKAVVTADGKPLPGAVSQAQATGAEPTPVPPSPLPSSASKTPSGPASSSGAPSSSATPSASPSAASAAGVATSGDELPGVPALTVSEPDTATFSTVGVSWAQTDITSIVVKLRIKQANGRWGTWTSLQPEDSAAPTGPPSSAHRVRGGTAPYFTGEGHGVQVIVQGTGGAVPQDVKVSLVDPGKSAADSLKEAPAATGKAEAAQSMPAVFSRAQWGADPSIMTWDPDYAPTLKAAVVHHTADSNNYTIDQVPGIIRSIYYYHAVTLGWGDIGYNVIADKFGRLFEGRYGGLASTVVGGHVYGFNDGTFGVSMLGNYDQVAVPQATAEAVAQIIAWKFSLFGINPTGTTTLSGGGASGDKYPYPSTVRVPTIVGHRDLYYTACPGQYGYAQLPWIRSRAAQLMPLYAKTTTVVQDGTTGNIPDVSPVHVGAATGPNGLATVFVRGLGNSAWYRTAKSGGGFGAWTQIPATGATSGPSVAMSDGTHLNLVLRGTDYGVWYNSATLNSDGTVGAWDGWRSLGGYATAAPTIASLGSGQLAVATRGLDGAVWERVFTGGAWSAWGSVGGYAWSAPELQADSANSRYVVSVIGTDNTVWQVGTSVTTPGAQGPWVGGGLASTLTPGTNGSSAVVGAATLMSFGGSDHQVELLKAADGSATEIGGVVTSIAGMTLLPGGTSLIFGRGTDNALWTARYQAGQPVSWTSLGGSVQ